VKNLITNSFKNKLVVLIAIICIVFFIIIGVVSNYIISAQISDIVEKSIQKSNERSVEFISGWFAGIKRELENHSDTPFIRQLPITRSMNWSKIELYLNSRYEEHSDIYEYLFIADPGGDYQAVPEGTGNVADKEFYEKTMNQANTIISEPGYSDIKDELVITIATPILLHQSSVENLEISITDPIGIVAGAINLNTLTELVAEIGVRHKDSYSYMINATGDIIAHPNMDLILEENITEMDKLTGITDAVLAQSSGQTHYDFQNETTHLYFNQIPGTNNWKLITLVPDEFIQRPKANILLSLGIMLIIVILILLVVSYWSGSYITKPIEIITDYSRKIANEDFSFSINKDLLQRKDEVGGLARSSILLKVSQELIRSTLNLDDIYDLGLNAIHKGLNISNVAILVSNNNEVEIIRNKGDQIELDLQQNIEGIFAQLQQTSKTVIEEVKVVNNGGLVEMIQIAIPIINSNNLEVERALVIFNSIENNNELTVDELDFLKTISNLLASAIENESMYSEIEKRVIRDEMTGLYNHSFFYEKLEQYIQTIYETGQRLALIILDADLFKNINDTYGHQAGDEVLIKLAELLKEICREDDFIARYGGEEFAIIIQGLAGEKVQEIAERIRKRVANNEFSHQGQIIEITISVGVSIISGDGRQIGKDELVKKTDESLYKAKDNGRNQTVFRRIN
jgi:methyl-accepting chemotaxis protein